MSDTHPTPIPEINTIFTTQHTGPYQQKFKLIGIDPNRSSFQYRVYAFPDRYTRYAQIFWVDPNWFRMILQTPLTDDVPF